MIREQKDRQRERKKERERKGIESGRGLRVEVEKRWTEIEVENNYEEDSVSFIRI